MRDAGVGKREINAYETGPCPDFIEVAVGATDPVDISPLKYPIRSLKVLAGSGTLAIKTVGSAGGADRTATLAEGEVLENPLQIMAIRGTSNGSSGITSIRVWK